MAKALAKCFMLASSISSKSILLGFLFAHGSIPDKAAPVQCYDYNRDLRPAKWGSGSVCTAAILRRACLALGQKRTLGNVVSMSALPPIADIPAQKERDRHNGRSPQSPALAFRNNRRRRRSFALAVRCVGLCGGRDTEERQRRCRQ